jgi:hypothetical protein
MSKIPFTIRLDEHVREAFEKLAATNHMDATTFAALWLSKLSELKAEHALDALTSIPKEYFKARPGRPTGGLAERDEAKRDLVVA